VHCEPDGTARLPWPGKDRQLMVWLDRQVTSVKLTDHKPGDFVSVVLPSPTVEDPKCLCQFAAISCHAAPTE
jgi:hypothetical protein